MQITLFGIPVLIRPGFLLLAGLLGYDRSSNPPLLIEWLVVVTVSILVHEFGHALAFRRYGHPTRIELHSMGGHTQSVGGGPLKNRQSAWISLAGPMAGFALAVLTLLIAKFAVPSPAPLLVAAAISDLLWVNIGWGIFNLLPIIPLDGGHIMQVLFKHRLRERWEVPAYGFSLTFALLCAAGAYFVGWTWSLMIALYFAVRSGMHLYDLKTAQ